GQRTTTTTGPMSIRAAPLSCKACGCQAKSRVWLGSGGFGHPPEVIGRPHKDWEGDDLRDAITMELRDDGREFSKPRAPSFRHQEEFVFLGELTLPDEERSYLGHNVHTRCKPVLDQAPSDAFRFLARGHRDQDHEGVLPRSEERRVGKECRSRQSSWPRDWSSDVCSSDLPARAEFSPPGGVRLPRRTYPAR